MEGKKAFSLKGFAADLDPRGRTPRQVYGITGLILTAIKYNLDRWLAALFQRSWQGINYLIPGETFSLPSLPEEERFFYLSLLAMAMPFVLIGVILTVRRLRDAGLSPLWALLFFVPVVNLFFFAVLCVLPTKPAFASDPADPVREARQVLEQSATGEPAQPEPTPTVPRPGTPAWEPDVPGPRPRSPFYALLLRILPENPLLNALITAVILGLVGACMVGWGANLVGSYGWGLFVGAPFCLGLVAALLHGVREERRPGQCVLVGFLALLVVIVAILIFAFEGMMCILMALPLLIPLNLLGSVIGYGIQKLYPRPEWPDTTTHISCTILALLPLFIGVEKWLEPSPVLLPVRTAIVINAAPERVWPNVVSFSELPPLSAREPMDWLFYTGIAYPVRARIEGSGVGAVRYCEFSTGAFVEPVTVWDPPRLLRFSVTDQPPTMRELSPYPEIHPPHLNHFLVSRQGQFLLTPLPDGRTRLEGTTWYQNRMWPQSYWRFWSDAIIHRIHARVLEHVRDLSEKKPSF